MINNVQQSKTQGNPTDACCIPINRLNLF